MNYQSLHDYFKDISENLEVTTQWVHNTPEYLPLYDKDSPVILLSLPFVSNGSFSPNLNETYQCNFVFYQRDEMDGSLDQNSQANMQQTLEILSQTNAACDEFLRLVDFNQISDTLETNSDLITIQSFSKGNAIRDNEVMTGTTLTLNISVADSFDYCCNENVLEGDLEIIL